MSIETLRARRRAIALFDRGLHNTEIATRLGVSRVAVSQWAKIYEQHGAEGLLNAALPGMRPRLTQAQRREMVSWLAHPPRELGAAADRWTGRELAAVVERRFGVKHSPAYCLRLCNALGASMKAAYRPPPVEKQRGIAGRPPKVRGEMLPRLKRALVEASRHRQGRGWTRRELAAFIREQCGIVCTPYSLGATLARMQLSLPIIPEWQRRIEERVRRPSRRQRARRLTIEQLAELSAALNAEPEVARSPERTRSLIRQRFGVTYATSYIPNLLRELAIRRRRAP